MGETLGSKSVFRVLFVFRCVCVVDVLGCGCVLVLVCAWEVEKQGRLGHRVWVWKVGEGRRL